MPFNEGTRKIQTKKTYYKKFEAGKQVRFWKKRRIFEKKSNYLTEELFSKRETGTSASLSFCLLMVAIHIS